MREIKNRDAESLQHILEAILFSQALVKLFIKNHQDKNNTTVRKKYSYLEGVVSIVGNVVLFGIKLAAGLFSGSIALIADAFHTLSDVISSVVVLISSYISAKPGDEDHPFGHGRSDYVGSIIVAVLLGVTGVEFFKSSLHKLLNPSSILVNWWIIGTVVVSILLKEWMARFAFYLGKEIDSPVLKADGGHHRSDAYSSIVVLVGVVGNYYGFAFLDGAVGIILSVMIVYAGIEIAKDNINDILGKAPDKKELNAIVQVALSKEGVHGVHDIIIHNYGNTKVMSLHIEVSNKLSLDDAHNLAERVEDLLSDELDYFATVHVDPLDLDNPQIQEMVDFLQEKAQNAPYKVSGIHDVRIVKTEKQDNLFFDVAIEVGLCREKKKELNNYFEKEIYSYYDNFGRVSIQIEPLFSY